MVNTPRDPSTYPEHSPTLIVALEAAICMCSHCNFRISANASGSYPASPYISNDRDGGPSTPAAFRSEDHISAEKHLQLWKRHAEYCSIVVQGKRVSMKEGGTL